MEIKCYKGLDCNPRWLDIDEGVSLSSVLNGMTLLIYIFSDSYGTLCYIEAEFPSQNIKTSMSLLGKIFHYVHYDVVLFFGLTEIKAQIAWIKSSVGAF